MAGPIATLTVRISAQLAEFQKAFADTSRGLHKFQSDFEGIATRASAIGTFLGNTFSKMAGAIASGISGAFKDAVRLSSEFSNAFIGLASVARAFGTNADEAATAARALASDGLLPVKDAATGLKNLLAAGFNLPQATQLMNAFKDSAAFGRQSALSFGDAVRSATEGVKNGNSILVDNAGVTKNLSQILKEAGFSAQDLSRASSDVGVRMALFNGILKETRAQTGDAAKLTQTYSGQVSRLNSQYDTLLASLGTVITQNATVAEAIGAVGNALQGLTTSLGNNRNGFNLVSDAVIVMVRAFAEVLNIIDMVQTAFAALQMVSNRTFAAFANIAIAMFKVAEQAEKIQQVTDPFRSGLHAKNANEAREAYTFLEGAVKGLADSSADAQTRSDRFGNTLQTVRARVTALAEELETTRGKTVELGTSGVVAGAALSTGLANAAKSAKELAAQGTLLSKIFARDAKQYAENAREWAAALRIADDSARGAVAAMLELRAAAPLTDLLVSTIELDRSLRVLAEGGFYANRSLATLNETADEAIASFKSLGSTIRESLINTLTQIPQLLVGAFTGGGGFMGAVSSIGTMLGSGIGASLGTALAKEMGLKAGSMLGSLVGPLGAALGGLAGSLLGKLFGGGSAGRDAVKDFAASFGGFDALRTKLNELGQEGENLWVRLTQGVGKNSPEQAKTAINAITDAFAEQAKKVAEAGTAAKETGDAQVAASAKAQAAMEAIDAELSSLIKSIENEAIEDEMGVIERNTRSRISAVQAEKEAAQKAIENMTQAAIDAANKLSGALDSLGKHRPPIVLDVEFRYPGDSDPRVRTASGTATNLGASGGPPIIVQTYLDGEKIAENQVPHLLTIAQEHGWV
jgi:hypothetical protein